MAELLSMTQTRKRLGVSKNHLRRLVQRHGLTLYENPLDAREKLLDFEQLQAALRPKPIGSR